MSCKMARRSAIGMMIVLAPLALAGCLGQEGDEPVSDPSASEQQLAPTSPVSLAVCGSLIAESRPLVCPGGWPSAAKCEQAFSSPTDVDETTVTSAINGLDGEVPGSRMVEVRGLREVHFEATIRSGEVFNPGKNTTVYTVSWCRKPTT